MSEKILTEIEEHICHLWLHNESSVNALAKKQTLAHRKLSQIQRQTGDISNKIDELGFTVGEFLAWICLSLGTILIAMSIMIWGWPI